MALLAAQDGKTTAMICSGDAGVYGMAGLVLSLAEKYPETEVVIVAGVTAALSGAARLGAPLMNDFAVISLSDLLTPKDVIEKRLRAAAAGDFSICLYNPSSKKRADYLSWACRIVSEYYAPDTPCGWVRMIGRQDEEKKTCTLQELTKEQVDMFTTVFIGSSRTSFQNGLLVTKRGYEKRVAVNRAGGKEKLRILLFGGTTEGRELAQRLLTLPVIFKGNFNRFHRNCNRYSVLRCFGNPYFSIPASLFGASFADIVHSRHLLYKRRCRKHSLDRKSVG